MRESKDDALEAAGESEERFRSSFEDAMIGMIVTTPEGRFERVNPVGGILARADALGLVVVAEGIETEEQAAVLRELGCERAQGYALARPAALEAIAALLSPVRAAPSSAPHR